MNRTVEDAINRIVRKPVTNANGKNGGGHRGFQPIHTNGHRTFGAPNGGKPAKSQGYSAAPKDRGAGIKGGKDDSVDPVPMGKTKRRGGIHIKAKNKGKLHEKLGVAKGKKIPVAKIEKAEHSTSPALRKEAQFAENARGFHHPGASDDASGHEMHIHVHMPDAGGY